MIKFDDIYTLAVKFNDEPNIIHVLKCPIDSKSPPRFLDFNHPRLGMSVRVYFKGVSTRGRKLYRYGEGNGAGAILGG
jgi:hypothetical protein